MTKQEEIRKGLYTLRFKGRYGKGYKLSYPDVDEILSYLCSKGVVLLSAESGRIESLIKGG